MYFQYSSILSKLFENRVKTHNKTKCFFSRLLAEEYWNSFVLFVCFDLFLY